VEFNSIDDIVEFAIEKEVEAADFYQAAAENEDVKGIASVLTEYAEEERKHEKMLKNLNRSTFSPFWHKRKQNIKITLKPCTMITWPPRVTSTEKRAHSF